MAFKVKNGIEAHRLLDQAAFNPQLHFTGMLEDRQHVRAVQKVIDDHSRSLTAYATQATPGVSCFPGMFSVELQFSDRNEMMACRKTYQDLFDEGGNFIRERRGRPALNYHFEFDGMAD